MDKDMTKIRPLEFSVKFKDAGCGWMADVDMSQLKEKIMEVRIEEIGDIVVDELICGLEGKLITMHKQRDIAHYRALIHSAPGSGSIPGIPAEQYASRYAFAGLLNIHPTHMNEDLTEDFNFVRVCPNVILPKSTQGKNTHDFRVEWSVFPNMTKLAASPRVLEYWYYGAVPE